MLKDAFGKDTYLNLLITATHRPEILRRTLESFHENLFKGYEEYIFPYINIDPIGSTKDKFYEVLDVCQHFFPNAVANRPKKAHFPTAFIWCWMQAGAPYVFHLEDDWLLLRKYDLQDMIIKMRGYAHLRFSIFKAVGMTCKNWKYFYRFNKGVYECPKRFVGTVGWCGHPSLNDGDFIRAVTPFLDPTSNPEKQIKGRNKNIGPILKTWKFGSYIEPNSPPNIQDIGRQWMVEKGFMKAERNKEIFTVWKKVPK